MKIRILPVSSGGAAAIGQRGYDQQRKREDGNRPIAEAQQAANALHHHAERTDDPEVREHLELAAGLFQKEADAALVRAELHNGHNSEALLNMVLGYIYDRKIGDSYGVTTRDNPISE